MNEVLPDRLTMYVNQAHDTNPAQMLRIQYLGFSG